MVCVSFLVSHSPEYKKSCCARPLPGNLSGTAALAVGRSGLGGVASIEDCENKTVLMQSSRETSDETITGFLKKISCWLLYENIYVIIYQPGFCGYAGPVVTASICDCGMGRSICWF